MKTPIDWAKINKLTEKLKLTILNEPETEVRIAIDKLRLLVNKPEFWASDWKEDK